MDVLEGNKLIGTTLFGAEYINDDPIVYPKGYYWQKTIDDKAIELPCLAEDWEFDCNWNWVISAVKQLRLVGYDIHIQFNGDQDFLTVWVWDKNGIALPCGYPDTDMMMVFESVVNATNHYNKQKESN